MVPFESLNAVSYSPSIVSMAQSESCIISEIKRDIGRKSRFLPRDAMHKHGLCGHVVSVRPSVCLSRSWIMSKRIKISSKIFYGKRHSNIPTGTPLTGASNAGGVCRNRDSEPISGFTSCC